MTTNLNPIHRRRRPLWSAPVLAFALGSGAMACSDGAPITGPTLSTAPTAPWVVRGTVFEHSTVSPERPLAGVPLRVFGGGTVVEVTSGADGAYAAVVPDTAPFIRVVASGPLHFTPCASLRPGGAARIEGPLDVHVVSGAAVSSSYLPNGYPMNWSARTGVWGSVRTSEGLEPVSGATVTFHGPEPLANPTASTVTDARGIYSLCGDSFSGGVVEARKDGYTPASAPPVYGWNFETTDLLLTRR